MGKVKDSLKGWFWHRDPVTPDEGDAIAEWVGEGGAVHPDGAPEVIDKNVNDEGENDSDD